MTGIFFSGLQFLIYSVGYSHPLKLSQGFVFQLLFLSWIWCLKDVWLDFSDEQAKEEKTQLIWWDEIISILCEEKQFYQGLGWEHDEKKTEEWM